MLVIAGYFIVPATVVIALYVLWKERHGTR